MAAMRPDPPLDGATAWGLAQRAALGEINPSAPVMPFEL